MKKITFCVKRRNHCFVDIFIKNEKYGIGDLFINVFNQSTIKQFNAYLQQDIYNPMNSKKVNSIGVLHKNWEYVCKGEYMHCISNEMIISLVKEKIRESFKPFICKDEYECISLIMNFVNLSRFPISYDLLRGSNFWKTTWAEYGREEQGLPFISRKVGYSCKIIDAYEGCGFEINPQGKVNLKTFCPRENEDFDIYVVVEIQFEDHTKERMYFTISTISRLKERFDYYFVKNPDTPIKKMYACFAILDYDYEKIIQEFNIITRNMIAGDSKLEILTKFSTFLDCPNLLNYQLNYPLNTPNLYYFDGNVETIE